MRILHVVPSVHPSWGGPPVVAHHLAAAQVGLGHQVGLVSFEPASERDWLDGLAKTIPHADGIDLTLLPARLAGAFSRGARRRLRAMVPHQDLVHIHSVWSPVSYEAAAASRAAGTSYVVCPHGNLTPWSLRQRKLKKRIALAIRYRRMLEHAAFYHVLNADEERGMAPLGLTRPSVVIPNGIFLEEIEPLPSPGAFRRSHPEIGDAPFVVFLSRLHHGKGLEHLAAGFAMLPPEPETRLVVIGPDAGARDAFLRQVADLGIAPRVHVVGPVYGAEKFGALVDAACFCLPSAHEGFSIAIIEALACGLPVVISDECHFPEVEEVGAGEVVARDGAAVGAALTRVMGDAERRRRMGANARELVRTRFTWPTIAERSVRAYEDALAAG